jgi:flagellar protein FliT
MNPKPLETYGAIEHICTQMLEAARRDDWDDVARLERKTRPLIDALRPAAGPVAYTAAVDRERMRVLTRIVRLDAEIRKLSQPWNRHLDLLLAPHAGGAQALPC